MRVKRIKRTRQRPKISTFWPKSALFGPKWILKIIKTSFLHAAPFGLLRPWPKLYWKSSDFQCSRRRSRAGQRRYRRSRHKRPLPTFWPKINLNMQRLLRKSNVSLLWHSIVQCTFSTGARFSPFCTFGQNAEIGRAASNLHRPPFFAIHCLQLF